MRPSLMGRVAWVGCGLGVWVWLWGSGVGLLCVFALFARICVRAGIFWTMSTGRAPVRSLSGAFLVLFFLICL